MDSRGDTSIFSQNSTNATRFTRPTNVNPIDANQQTKIGDIESSSIDMHTENLTRHQSIRKSMSLRSLPDSMLLMIFSYLTPVDLIRCTRVCHRWHSLINHHQQLWRRLYLRPECGNGHIGAVHVRRLDMFLNLLSNRCASSLIYIDLPVELITIEVLRELAIHCPNLEYLTLDFSAAMQLRDFNDLHEFPCNLKRLCICLSEVIFLEAFMRRIYGYLSSLQTLHIIGTIEKSSMTTAEESDNYETINISKIKAHVPNLRVINFYGVTFLDDSHIEAIACGCIHLECLAVNYCIKVSGSSFKVLINRCSKLKCLLLQNTGLLDNPIINVDWSTSQINELDISSTDLSENALIELFSRIPKLQYLAVSFCDGFTDNVLNLLIDRGKLNGCRALDFSNTVNLNIETVHRLLTSSNLVSQRLEALCYTGNDSITEQFWIDVIRYLRRLKILIMGTSHSWFRQMSRRIHIDQILEACAIHCTQLRRLEIQWDPENLRLSENSSKFIDHLRIRCNNLLSFVLSDGPYYESTKANFERAERCSVVRTTTMYRTSIVSALNFHSHLKFN